MGPPCLPLPQKNPGSQPEPSLSSHQMAPEGLRTWTPLPWVAPGGTDATPAALGRVFSGMTPTPFTLDTALPALPGPNPHMPQTPVLSETGRRHWPSALAHPSIPLLCRPSDWPRLRDLQWLLWASAREVECVSPHPVWLRGGLPDPADSARPLWTSILSVCF